MEIPITPEGGLAGLFVSSFLAATLLPGGSELVLFALLRQYPDWAAVAIAVATVGNTLGGMTTYALARLIPSKTIPARLDIVRRYGSPALILAWAPLAGDALCAAAGWLRINWIAATAWMALGKLARYVVVAGTATL